jgi:hypothetical protein
MLFKTIGIVWRVSSFTVSVLLFLIEACFWAGAIAIGLGERAIDLYQGRKALMSGKAICEKGHETTTENLPLECQRCGFKYIGSIWVCASKECGARTQHISCSVCSLSIRSPYRWGREEKA